MLDEINELRLGEIDLQTLVNDLRGLYVEADPHDEKVRQGFEVVWAQLDGQLELRTESWAPAGSASDEGLQRALDEFRDWVTGVLAGGQGTDHD